MTGVAQRQDAAASFDPLRPTLLRVAYRMMGSMTDAEDVVQDAFLRWMATDRAAVRQPESFLRRTVTRLCLDQLKSARRRREVYPGEWLPEPVVESDEDETDDVTLPLMMALERLSPLERAAFILHDVFGLGFEEVANTIDRDPAATRQLAARARSHVRQDRPRFDLPKERGIEIAEAFFKASRSGDMTALSAMLAADVSMHTDGGGKKPAAMKPMLGFDAVMRFHAALAEFFGRNGSRFLRFATINGLPGFVTVEAGETLQTTALDIRGGRIVGIYVMRNPDKLKQVERALN
ncbi:MAG: sigma-70 family RNA polymerase sigma factor [Pseudomonadota bacterium]|nr:sigma-70 family RNA polymerase sigma factor [Pseudomonadota bacterium]